MQTPRPHSPAAGGFPIAAGALIGAGFGFALGEVTALFLIGTGVGIAIAVAIWLLDRRG